MSRSAKLDAVVVGGGVVGAACALALARCDLDVALVEAGTPAAWSAATPDLRVYAFAPDNAALLDGLGVWRDVAATRVQPYRRMRVWDAAGGGELHFDADAYGRAQLGWIVENALLQDRLWAALPAAGVRVLTGTRVAGLEQDAAGVRLQLDDGGTLAARWAIAADGGRSALRALAGVEVDAHDYRQRGVVAFVRTETRHEDTAWQRFLPTGPLAFLPFADGLCSIVWSLPEAEAQRVLALSPERFEDELERAFAGRLGAVQLASARAAFPLRRQLARTQLAGRVLLAGDAAHTVHPLAGQGVNLGLRDVASLRDAIRDAQVRRIDWASPHRMARWARNARSRNTVAALGFEAINGVYSNDELHLTLARGHLLGVADRVPGMSARMWKHAAGA